MTDPTATKPMLCQGGRDGAGAGYAESWYKAGRTLLVEGGWSQRLSLWVVVLVQGVDMVTQTQTRPLPGVGGSMAGKMR